MSNSFTADTLIHTEDGLVTIAKIKLGQKVFAVDPKTGESGFYEVVYIPNHPVDELLYISIDDDIMQVTPNHPIYIEGRGWVNAEDVALGDRLRRKDGGWANALAIERVLLDEPMLVYNFTVAGMHTYFVLEVGVLVHNCGGGPGSSQIKAQTELFDLNTSSNLPKPSRKEFCTVCAARAGLNPKYKNQSRAILYYRDGGHAVLGVGNDLENMTIIDESPFVNVFGGTNVPISEYNKRMKSLPEIYDATQNAINDVLR